MTIFGVNVEKTQFSATIHQCYDRFNLKSQTDSWPLVMMPEALLKPDG